MCLLLQLCLLPIIAFDAHICDYWQICSFLQKLPVVVVVTETPFSTPFFSLSHMPFAHGMPGKRNTVFLSYLIDVFRKWKQEVHLRSFCMDSRQQHQMARCASRAAVSGVVHVQQQVLPEVIIT